MFVRVTGQLKTFGTKRYVNTNLAIRPAINKNNCHEIDFHFLECIAVTLQTEHGSVCSLVDVSYQEAQSFLAF